MVRKANFFVTYNVISFGDKEEYTGPNDLNACVCRFCGKKYPEVRFKKKNAHAIPDALGNKLVFCNDECQSCNAALSPIDKELAEYLKFRRSENKIVNKKNKIIKVWGHNFFYDGSIG
ncbi:HNH endonuclease [Bacteroides ovatus]